MEQVISQNKKAKRQEKVERVYIGKEESTRLSQWLNQVEESTRGLLKLTKSDLTRFLIASHKEQLCPQEMKQIHATHYDPLKHIQLLTPLLKRAMDSGDQEEIARLGSELSSIQSLILGAPSKPHKVRKKKRTTEIRKLDASKLKQLNSKANPAPAPEECVVQDNSKKIEVD